MQHQLNKVQQKVSSHQLSHSKIQEEEEDEFEDEGNQWNSYNYQNTHRQSPQNGNTNSNTYNQFHERLESRECDERPEQDNSLGFEQGENCDEFEELQYEEDFDKIQNQYNVQDDENINDVQNSQNEKLLHEKDYQICLQKQKNKYHKMQVFVQSESQNDNENNNQSLCEDGSLENMEIQFQEAQKIDQVNNLRKENTLKNNIKQNKQQSVKNTSNGNERKKRICQTIDNSLFEQQEEIDDESEYQQIPPKKRKRRPDSKFRTYRVRPPRAQLQIINDLPIPCHNCKEDSYDTQHIEIINYLMYKKIPQRIMEINNMQKRYKMCGNLKIKASKYEIYRCEHGSIYLFSGNQMVPMLKTTLKLLDRTHMPNHHDEKTMRKLLKAREKRVDDLMFRKYTYKYLTNCQQCCQSNIIFRRPLIKSFTDCIYTNITNIPVLKQLYAKTSTDKQKNNVALDQLGFDLHNCLNDCQTDSYNERDSALVLFLSKGTHPSRIQNIKDVQVRKREKQIIRVISFRFRVFACAKGTLHLWRFPVKLAENCNMGNRPQKQGLMRMPMLNQLHFIASKLHFDHGHHSANGFYAMMKNSGYDRKRLREYFYSGLKFCRKCELQSQSNPIKTIKKPKIVKIKKQEELSERSYEQVEQQLAEKVSNYSSTITEWFDHKKKPTQRSKQIKRNQNNSDTIQTTQHPNKNSLIHTKKHRNSQKRSSPSSSPPSPQQPSKKNPNLPLNKNEPNKFKNFNKFSNPSNPPSTTFSHPMEKYQQKNNFLHSSFGNSMNQCYQQNSQCSYQNYQNSQRKQHCYDGNQWNQQRDQQNYEEMYDNSRQSYQSNQNYYQNQQNYRNNHRNNQNEKNHQKSQKITQNHQNTQNSSENPQNYHQTHKTTKKPQRNPLNRSQRSPQRGPSNPPQRSSFNPPQRNPQNPLEPNPERPPLNCSERPLNCSEKSPHKIICEPLTLGAPLTTQLSLLSGKGFQILVDPDQTSQNNIGRLLLLSKQMIKQRSKFCERIQIIQLETLVSGWCASIFTGIGQSSQIIILAIFLSNYKLDLSGGKAKVQCSFEDYCFGISQFLSLDPNTPTTIVTDYKCKNLGLAIDSLIHHSEQEKIRNIRHCFSRSSLEQCQRILGNQKSKTLKPILDLIYKTHNASILAMLLDRLQKHLKNQTLFEQLMGIISKTIEIGIQWKKKTNKQKQIKQQDGALGNLNVGEWKNHLNQDGSNDNTDEHDNAQKPNPLIVALENPIQIPKGPQIFVPPFFNESLAIMMKALNTLPKGMDFCEFLGQMDRFQERIYRTVDKLCPELTPRIHPDPTHPPLTIRIHSLLKNRECWGEEAQVKQQEIFWLVTKGQKSWEVIIKEKQEQNQIFSDDNLDFDFDLSLSQDEQILQIPPCSQAKKYEAMCSCLVPQLQRLPCEHIFKILGEKAWGAIGDRWIIQ